ncbi:hypothetical protein NADFUDRAFT_14217, partial [Nadsonia fulvescens var. elongata DSM 6958]
NLPNPCLLSIILTVETHNGPQFVFHYPPNPSAHNYEAAAQVKVRLDDDFNASVYSDRDNHISNPSSCQSHPADKIKTSTDGSTDLIGLGDSYLSEKTFSNEGQIDNSASSINTTKNLTSGSYIHTSTAWDHVLGFETDFLGEILCPPRNMCNSRFELTVDDMVFLGLPRHSYPNGSWKRQPKKTAASVGGGSSSKTNQVSASRGLTNNCSMRMFHVVFAMNPPVFEYNERVDQMYSEVIKLFTKELKRQQSKSCYVWNEIKKIALIRENAALEGWTIRDLYTETLSSSTLALAIAQLYIAISRSEIANVFINDQLRSFQLPINTHFSSLPGFTEGYIGGSSLTTNNTDINNNTVDSKGKNSGDGKTFSDKKIDVNEISNNYHSSFDLPGEHFTLLLLDEPENVIRFFDNDETMTIFIRELNPVLPFRKLIGRHGFSYEQIDNLSRHLVYWRKARAILPIHYSNIYIVSPLAPMTYLNDFMIQFKEKFRDFPPLSKMLSALSTGKPRRLSEGLIPSKNHNESYYQVIAWMLRYGFITQLRTFLWIKITKRIKTAVLRDEEIAREIKEDKLNELNKNNSKRQSDVSSTDNSSKNKSANGLNQTGDNHSNGMDSNGNEINASTYLRKLNEMSCGSNNNNNSGGNSVGKSAFIINPEDLLEDSIILEPLSASREERKWIAKMLENKSPEIKKTFNKVMRYLNGKHSLEKVIVKEQVSKHRIRELLHAIDENIIFVRHW